MYIISVKTVCMIGDFNARTGNVDDFLLPDESLLKNNVLAEQVNYFILAEDILIYCQNIEYLKMIRQITMGTM